MRKLFYSLPFIFSPCVMAKGLSPYLPLNISPEIEQQIEQVMALTPGAPVTKPYKAVDVRNRLKQIQNSYPGLYSRVSSYLRRYTRQAGVTHQGAKISLANSNKKALPNQRNIKNDSSYQISAGGFAFLNPYVYASTGMVYADGESLIQTNSHIGFGYEYAQVEVGYREHWFSPFQDSAMLVSTHAKSSPSITVSNATPITDWNIRYEVFFSRLERVEGIRLGDEVFPGKPYHAGLHLSFTPLDFWTLGFNRTLQFGGGKREVSFRDAIEAIINPNKKDNVFDQNDPNFEFGNQQASVTSKFNFELGTPVSLYMEYAGEDTVSGSNFKLGNVSLSMGVFLPQLTQDISVRYEMSDWKTNWYTHHLYQNGYTNDGQVMGHWGGGERFLGKDTPAQTHNLNFNWNMGGDQILDVNLRTVQNKENAVNAPVYNNKGERTGLVNVNYQRGYEASVRYSFANKHGFWGLELNVGKDVYGESFNRLSAFYRW